MNAAEQINLQSGWKELLAKEFESTYIQELKLFLKSEKQAGKVVFPKETEYFRALDLTPPDQVKVVILGQDPYHGDGQAHGLAFSVRKGVRIPPSLVNIYKELETDLGLIPANHGYLESWAEQGVLLLNSVLTVRQGEAASHQKQGWEKLTDAIIARVNECEKPAVFMLWGAYAQKKAAFVDKSRHLILTAPHPSPLSAHRGFLGCKHFSKANAFLKEQGRSEIDWKVQN